MRPMPYINLMMMVLTAVVLVYLGTGKPCKTVHDTFVAAIGGLNVLVALVLCIFLRRLPEKTVARITRIQEYLCVGVILYALAIV